MFMQCMLEKYNPHSATCHDVAWFQLSGFTNSHNNIYYTAKKKKKIPQ
jgi:hypothetical protein